MYDDDFSDPWREHCDHVDGEATEQQNALAVSQMTRTPDDSDRITDAITAGLFVVVLEGSEYCRFTDALMGSRKVLHSTHATRKEANQEVIDIGDMEDISVYVRPHAPVIKLAKISMYRYDEIPF